MALAKVENNELYLQFQNMSTEVEQTLNRPLTSEEIKQIQISLYADTFIEKEE